MTESSNATFASIFAAFDTSPQCQRIEGIFLISREAMRDQLRAVYDELNGITPCLPDCGGYTTQLLLTATGDLWQPGEIGRHRVLGMYVSFLAKGGYVALLCTDPFSTGTKHYCPKR